jgi:hypothetical protein
VKGTGRPPLSILHAFYRQKVLVTFITMCVQTVSILRCAVAVGEGFSRLGLVSGGPPLSLFDMLLATTGGGPGT